MMKQIERITSNRDLLDQKITHAQETIDKQIKQNESPEKEVTHSKKSPISQGELKFVKNLV